MAYVIRGDMKTAKGILAVLLLSSAGSFAAPVMQMDGGMRALRPGEKAVITLAPADIVAAPIGAHLEIESPAGPLEVVKDAQRESEGGVTFVSGYLPQWGVPYRFQAAIAGNVATGELTVPGHSYRIVPRQGGQFLEAIPDAPVRCGNEEGAAVAPRNAQKAMIAKSGSTMTDAGLQALFDEGLNSQDEVTADVMVLFSPKAAAKFASTMNQVAATLVGDLDSTLRDSGTLARARLVHVDQLSSLGGATTLSGMLEAVTLSENVALGLGAPPPAPELAGISSMRSQYGADIVMTIVDRSERTGDDCTNGACFVGLTAGPVGVQALNFGYGAYSVVDSSTTNYEATFVHEAGHIFGAGHDYRYATAQGYYDWARGMYFPNATGTAMSSAFQPMRLFSNPDLHICVSGPNGNACGVPAGQPGQADNALAARQLRFLVANYRAQTVPNVPSDGAALWWNPNESGWGIHITQRHNVAFAAWFTYDASGNAKWYVASSCPVSGSTCSGPLYETTLAGGSFDVAGAFDPSKVQISAVGSLTINFSNPSIAVVSYTVHGVSGAKNVQRQLYRTYGPNGAYDWNGLWWNPQESGWGMSITQQHDILFLAWYTYDASGKPTWYVASDCALNAAGNGCSGSLYATNGPLGPDTGAAFNPAAVQIRQVGSISVSFDDADNGSLTYTVDGKSGTRRISRQTF
jgi:hypothetical protein